MKIMAPVSCCFCVPLRKGLLCIGYIRLILCLFAMQQYISYCILFPYDARYEYSLERAAVIISQLVELTFTLMLIVAAHKKSFKLFGVYYFYSIAIISVYLIFVVLIACEVEWSDLLFSIMCPYSIYQYIDIGLFEMLLFGTLTILLQAYLTLLVRSQAHKLKELSRDELAKQSEAPDSSPFTTA